MILNKEQRVEVASAWWETLDDFEKKDLGIPTFGSVTFSESKSDFFDKVYSEKFMVCFSKRYSHILDRINSCIQDKRSTDWISDNSAKAAKEVLIFKSFSSIEAKDTYLEAIEDLDIKPIHYTPELGYLLMQYGKTEFQNNN